MGYHTQRDRVAGRLLRLAVVGAMMTTWGCLPQSPNRLPSITSPETDQRRVPSSETDPKKEEVASAVGSSPRGAEIDPTGASPGGPTELPGGPPEGEGLPPGLTWDERLEQARRHIAEGATAEAERTLADLASFQPGPTAEQAEQLATVRRELEARLARRELRAAVERLGSEDREEVLAAQERLFERADAALPLLRESVAGEDPVLTRNALETLRLLQRPEATLPIMVEVLGRRQQQASWPEAVRQIELCAAPGAGGPLLELAVRCELPEQRAAALKALAKVVDPPEETVVALLPLMFEDGPELAAALTAARHALAVHGQQGLLAGRGLPAGLSAAQIEQLGALPQRLAQIMSADESEPPSDAARAARMLAIAMRQIPADPLPGVKVLAFSDELPDSPAAAVVDGQWNTTDPKLMWRHSIKQQGSIVLDLGEQRTIAGVRIFNLNEPGAPHRGWKEVAVSVGSTASALTTPAATGIVPQAPGTAEGIDYSTTIPLDFARGRYVRLQATSPWRQDTHAGLTEVQVLGF